MSHCETLTDLRPSSRSPADRISDGPTGAERLRPLLDAAAQLDPHDHIGWRRLGEESRVVIAVLAADGCLPRHLAVDPDDPPVLIARLLSVAWRHTARLRAEGPR